MRDFPELEYPEPESEATLRAKTLPDRINANLEFGATRTKDAKDAAGPTFADWLKSVTPKPGVTYRIVDGHSVELEDPCIESRDLRPFYVGPWTRATSRGGRKRPAATPPGRRRTGSAGPTVADWLKSLTPKPGVNWIVDGRPVDDPWIRSASDFPPFDITPVQPPPSAMVAEGWPRISL